MIKAVGTSLTALCLLLTTACATNGLSVNGGAVSNASGTTAASKGKPAADTPTWGKRYTWPDGTAIEVSPPTPCKPTDAAFSGTSPIPRAVSFTITVVNGGAKPMDAGDVIFGAEAQFNGRSAESVFDSGGECKNSHIETGTVLPGKAFTAVVVYAVGAQPGEMQLAFNPVNFDADKAVFIGQA